MEIIDLSNDDSILSRLSSTNDKLINNKEKYDLILCGYKCSECNSIPEIINIDFQKETIEMKCPNHQREIQWNDFINETKNNNYYFSVCNICKKNIQKNDLNIFKYCFDCKLVICPDCFIKHNLNHNIVYNNEYNYKCQNHFNEIFTSFCVKCQQNICKECKKSKMHKEHIKYDFLEIEPTIEELSFISEFCSKLKNNIKILEEQDKNEINELKNFKNKRLSLIDKIFKNQSDVIINEINQKINDKYKLYVKKLQDLYLKYLDDSNKLIEEYNKLKEYTEKEKENSLASCQNNYKKAKNLTEAKYDSLIKKCKINNEKLKAKYNNIIILNDIIINTYYKNKNQYYYIINVSNNIKYIRKYDEEMPKIFLKEINDKYNININEENIEIEKNIITTKGIQNLLSKMNKEKIQKFYINSSNVETLEFLDNYNFNKLKSFSMINCNINIIDNLKNFKCCQLKVLDLSNNKISDIKGLKNTNFISLEILNLMKNEISDIKILVDDIFRNLKEINLSYNNIVDIKVFNKAKFIKIKTLDLSFNKIKNIFSLNKNHLKDLVNLKIDNQK